MKLFIGLLLACVLFVEPVWGYTPVFLSCNVLSPSGTDVECDTGGWPYQVPVGKTLCVTDLVLINKFPYDPPAYGTNMRTMYFATWGISIPAHHPQVSFNTPIRYGSGTLMRAWILNGMSEAQYVYGILSGFLSSTVDCKS